MKKTILKIAIYIFLIPLAVELLFTVLYSFLYANTYSVGGYWIEDWMVYTAESILDYLSYPVMYLSIGATAYFVFFEKPKRSVPMVFLLAAFAALCPILRYPVRAIFSSMLSVDDVFWFFTVDIFTALYVLGTFAIGLLVVLAGRAFYLWVLKEKPTHDARILSPKHPIGLTMMIFFAALAVLSSFLFVLDGSYTGEDILSLAVEIVIDVVGFFLAILGAFLVKKWNENTGPVETKKK